MVPMQWLALATQRQGIDIWTKIACDCSAAGDKALGQGSNQNTQVWEAEAAYVSKTITSQDLFESSMSELEQGIDSCDREALDKGAVASRFRQ